MIDRRIAELDFCDVTTIGRVSGRYHMIEIWFAADGDTIFILAQSGHSADWVKNVKRAPNVPVRIGEHTFSGRARIIEDADEGALARRLLLEKYGPRYSGGGTLDGWGRTALPIAIDLQR